ncbi:tRNA (adenosine(37)-N6)-dimethylallyltransferase MiaA [Mycoplasmatota bacterium]|nr:tRNA (adenosine(37)-N6)-dimethylallyltransferase MiaA [Mycoplasmatota bacterium]
MKKVIVIVGPTASGKTKLSIDLAKALHTDIINGDSVQIYKRLDIGSAKITDEEKQGIKHHLLDVIEPSHKYSVYQYQQDVRAMIKDIDLPMIVGGTGLYIKAALYDYQFDPESKHHDNEDIYQKYSTQEIYEMLIKLDPNIKIDEKNRRRVIRALQLAKEGHHRSQKQNKDVLLYEPLIIYLDLDRQVLEQRLIKRLEIQLAQGFINEVKSLLDDDIEINAIGYRAIASYLKEEITLEEAKQLIIKKSKALAKKQKTWFKNQMRPIMFDALSDTLYEDVLQEIKTFLKN